MNPEDHDAEPGATPDNVTLPEEGSASETPQPAPRWGLVKTMLWGILVFGVYSVVQLLAGLAYMAMTGMLDRGADLDIEALASNGTLLAVATVASAVVCVPLVMGIIRIKTGADLRAYLGLRGVSRRAVLVWLAIISAFYLLSDVFAVTFDRPVVHEFMLDAYTTADPLWLLWLAVVVAAPVFEEIFYRGFLYYGLAGSRVGVTGATVISALAFAGIHIQYQLFEIAVVFAMGILLAVARHRTGSILVPIGMHAMNNLVATVETAMAVVR